MINYVQIIHERVAEARQRGCDDYEGPLSLAAHLFAISCCLLQDQRDPGLFNGESVSVIRSWEDTLNQLGALGPETDVHTLYWMIIRILCAVEASLTERDGPILPDFTEIKQPLGGKVYHWLRPDSELARLRSDRFQDAPESKRPPPPPHHPTDHLNTLGMFWESDPLLPAFQSPAKQERHTIPLLKDSGRSAAVNGLFKIALCPLLGDFHPVFEIERSGRDFTTCRRAGIHNCVSMQEHLTGILEAASEGGVHLLVFPELCVDKSMRDHIRNWLFGHNRKRLRDLRSVTLQGIIAGSFHVWRTANPNRPYNETVLLDQKGKNLMQHEKRGKFRIRRDQVNSAPQFFIHRPKTLQGEIEEKIQYGNHFQILETALGRLAVVICADVLEADPYGYQPLIERLHPDLLFIISMSAETERFESFFRRMAEHGIGTLFVNAACICDPQKSPILAAANLALFEPAGAPPSCLRWVWSKSAEDQAEFLVQRYDFGVHGDERTCWKCIGFTDATGVSWLGDRWGLVVNLGVQWQQSNP